jgi:protein-tyrosine phosphatase
MRGCFNTHPAPFCLLLMFDLHNHLLPDIDDGARNWDMAMAMAQMAYEDGVRGMVCTPHNSAWWSRYFQDKVVPLTREFQQRIRDKGWELEVGPGAEVYIELDLLKRLKDGRAATLNGSRYLLVELGFTSWPLYVDDMMFQLQAAGYTPVLAHPERYAAVIEKPHLMQALAERGIIAQVTSGSLEGKFGSRAHKTGMLLLERNWAHYIATDAHELVNRTPTMQVPYQILKAHFGAERAKQMTSTIPEMIFRNQDLMLESPLEYEPPQHSSFFGTLFRR